MRILLIAVAVFALAGCSSGDLERLTSYIPIEHPNAQQQAPDQQPPEQQAPEQHVSVRQQFPAQAEAPPIVQATAVRADRTADSAIRCRAVASQRASDGALMGYDDDAQKTIYDGTYANCMAWDAGHIGSAH